MRDAGMRAAVLEGPKKVRIIEVAKPEPRDGEVRIRLEGCGLCGSNLPPWEGRPWFTYPFAPGAPGHEGWGTVDRIGPGVAGLCEGDRVATLSNSAFADFQVIPSGNVVRLPAALSDAPFPGEPIGCACNVFRRAEIQKNQTVAVVGVGFLGAIAVRLSVEAGARVLAIGRRPFALELARGLGAAECIPLENTAQVVEQVRHLTDGRMCERVIEAVGAQEPLDLAGELTCERGRLVIAGYHQEKRTVNMQLWNWRGLDVICAHERDAAVYRQGIDAAIEAVTSGVLQLRPLLTHTFALEDLSDAFEAMTRRPEGFLKAMVRM